MNSSPLTALHTVRRDNLRLLVNKYDGQKPLAARLGCNRSYLSQMIGKNPTKEISERTARSIETKLLLPLGWLDTVRGA